MKRQDLKQTIKEEIKKLISEGVGNIPQDVIDKLAKYHLDKRYHDYMSGSSFWSTETDPEARVLNIIYNTPESEINTAIEERIKSMCKEKGWGNFSKISDNPKGGRGYKF